MEGEIDLSADPAAATVQQSRVMGIDVTSPTEHPPYATPRTRVAGLRRVLYAYLVVAAGLGCGLAVWLYGQAGAAQCLGASCYRWQNYGVIGLAASLIVIIFGLGRRLELGSAWAGLTMMALLPLGWLALIGATGHVVAGLLIMPGITAWVTGLGGRRD